MPKPNISVSDATDDFDVLGPDVGQDDGDPEGENWNSNDLMRGEGDPETTPLDEEDDDELEAGPEDEDQPDDSEEDPDGDEDGEEEEVEELGALDPPANWPEAVRQHFAQLPPHLQHWLFDSNKRMTADYTRKTQEVAQVRQQYADFDRVISPHVQKWALNGMNPATAVHQLIALSDFATNQPTEFLKYFANLRGVDLSQLGATPASTDEYVDPQVTALRQEQARIQASLNQLASGVTQQQQAAQQADYQRAFYSTNSAIDSFANRPGPDGKAAYPFFNMLEEDMAALIESGRARTLHEAYEAAQWANPHTRSKLLARSRVTETAKARQRTEEARRAASSLTGASRGNGSPATEEMSIKQLLHAGFDGDL